MLYLLFSSLASDAALRALFMALTHAHTRAATGRTAAAVAVVQR